MPPTAKEAPKKRNRKRKRRQAASSSSSSSSASSEEEGAPTTKPATANQSISQKQPIKVDTEDSSSSSSSYSSSDSSEDEYGDDENAEMKSPARAKRHLPSQSPSPADHRLPINIPLQPANEEEKRKDAEMKEGFRKFWMMTTAEGFKDELGQIQKEPNMTQPKLSMLIEALSAGANVYMPSNESASTSGRSEVELLLGVHKWAEENK